MRMTVCVRVCFSFFFKGKSWQLLFYDDITTVSDICVMAVSRFRVESEAPGDIVSAVLWTDPHIQSVRGRARESVTEQESMREKD